MILGMSFEDLMKNSSETPENIFIIPKLGIDVHIFRPQIIGNIFENEGGYSYVLVEKKVRKIKILKEL